MKGYKIGKKKRLDYIYLENVIEKYHENTYCPKCKNLVIERNYPIYAKSYLKDGFCKSCGEKIKGVWK